jgi:hypothetical protein
VGPRAVLDTLVKRKIPSPRRESNPGILKRILKETECDDVDWIHLAQVAGSFEHSYEFYGSIKSKGFDSLYDYYLPKDFVPWY